MTHRQSYTLGLIVMVIVAFATSSAEAAGTKGARYYATPSWNQTLACETPDRSCPRFLVLTNMNSEAVLDRETGLVWERSLAASEIDWFSAQSYCINLVLGNRKGFRLPTVQELASLVDPTRSDPALPSGHPFINVLPFHYWSATTYAPSTSEAWVVDFGDGQTFDYSKVRATFSFAWCVRGGQGVDLQ